MSYSFPNFIPWKNITALFPIITIRSQGRPDGKKQLPLGYTITNGAYQVLNKLSKSFCCPSMFLQVMSLVGLLQDQNMLNFRH